MHAQAHREVGPADMRCAYRGFGAVAKPQAVDSGCFGFLFFLLACEFLRIQLQVQGALTPALSRDGRGWDEGIKKEMMRALS